MSFTFGGREIRRVGVVGCGRIGPGIALFLSRALGPHGVPVFITDLSPEALDRGREHVARRLLREVNLHRLSPEEARAAGNNIRFAPEKSLLVGCDLVVEAVPERVETKVAVFEELERLLHPQAILASNSSHLEPGILFAGLRRPERALVLHHFFPADSNLLVEVVPGPRTQVDGWCLRFYEALGKIPIRSGPRFGYGVNPVFEGLFLAALREAERGIPIPVLDAIACRALGMTAGPFTTANLSRSSDLRKIGLEGYASRLMPWFGSTPLLDEKVSRRENWETAGMGETLSYTDVLYQQVRRRLLGAYFGLACEVLESGQADLGDLETAAAVGLSMSPPFSLMNQMGPERTRQLVEEYAREHPGFRIPRHFGPWTIPVLARDDRGDVAVVVLKRPERLNSLTPDVYRQIDREFAAIRKDPRIRAAVLTGFGIRAFSTGLDAATLAALKTPEDARRFCRETSEILSRLAGLGKPVVCALNGPATGAAAELAYACTARIARRDLPALFSHPEVRMGIIPLTGGGQRLIRLIHFPVAWKLLRTGGSLSSAEALRLGLVLEETGPDLVDRAVEIARALPPPPSPAPLRPPAAPPEVDLGGLSRRVDEILRRSLLRGARLTLDKALALEPEAVAEVFSTKDCRIGLENYLRTKLREPARFAHA